MGPEELAVCKKVYGDGTLILYLHETWAIASVKFMNCWQSNEGVGITLANASKSLTAVHLGRSNGFVRRLCVSVQGRYSNRRLQRTNEL